MDFTQITESVSNDENQILIAYEQLQERERKIKELLEPLNVIVTTGSIRKLDWGNHIQFRQDYTVKKSGKKPTWDDIYGLINSVKAVYYKK